MERSPKEGAITPSLPPPWIRPWAGHLRRPKARTERAIRFVIPTYLCRAVAFWTRATPSVREAPTADCVKLKTMTPYSGVLLDVRQSERFHYACHPSFIVSLKTRVGHRYCNCVLQYFTVFIFNVYLNRQHVHTYRMTLQHKSHYEDVISEWVPQSQKCGAFIGPTRLYNFPIPIP